MVIKYQLRDWNDHFENAGSRPVDHCRWACVPNKQDGLPYKRTVAKEETLLLYAAFVAIALMLSKQRKPRTGWVTDTGTAKGTPYTALDLHLKTGVPEKVITGALVYFSDPKYMGQETWLIRFENGKEVHPSPEPLKAPEEEPPEEELPRNLRIKFDDKKGIYGYTDDDVREWAEAYPALNIPQKIKILAQWCKDNPAKRPKKKVAAFLSRCFSREQESGGHRLGGDSTWQKLKKKEDDAKRRKEVIQNELTEFAKQLDYILTGVDKDDAGFWVKIKDVYGKNYIAAEKQIRKMQKVLEKKRNAKKDG